MSKQAIVMLSVGERPWVQDAFDSFKWIADRWRDVDTHLVTSDDADDLDTTGLVAHSGRENKRAYALKSYYPWLYLTKYKYEKILMVDDGCVIHPSAPNLFDACANSELAYAVTSKKHAETSFLQINQLVNSSELHDIVYDSSLYGNSGVVLYDQAFAEHTTPEKIADARACLNKAFPHQTLLYYLISRSGLSPAMLSQRWNAAPHVPDSAERANMKNARPHVDPTTYITHITGHYKNRNTLVRDVADFYREQREHG